MIKSNQFSTFFKNFFYVSVGSVVSQFFNLAATIYITGNFGKDKMGVVDFSAVIVTYFFSVSCLGLQGLGVIEVNRHRNDVKATVDTIVSLRIVMSILVFILLLIVVAFIPVEKNLKIMLALNGLTILAASFYTDWLFNGMQEMKYVSIASIIKNLSYTVLIGSILISGVSNSMYVIPLSLATGTLISSSYLFYIYLKKYKQTYKFTFNLVEYKRLIGSSWPFYFNGILALINLNMDSFMLGIMKGSGAVGLYGSVYKVVSALILIISFFFTPIFPMLIQNYNDGKFEVLSLIINKLRKLMLTISIPLTIGALMLNKEIIRTLYRGEEFVEASTTFLILMLYVSILCIREIYAYELSAWGQQKRYMKAVLISAIYNIIGNAILIPHFGIEGAAINTLMSEVINYTIMRRAARKTLKIEYENTYIIRILLSSIFLAAAVYLMKLVTSNAIYIIAISGMVYGLAIFLTKAFTIKELKTLLLKKQ